LKDRALGVFKHCWNPEMDKALWWRNSAKQDSNETDPSEYRDYPSLKEMSPEERDARIKDLWLQAYKKARGASLIVN